MRALLGLMLCAVIAVGCGDDQDPAGASALWQRIHADNYRSWTRAPGYPNRRPSDTLHSDAVDIYVNDVVARALAEGRPLTSWPVGSLIVKDGYDDDGTHDLVAVMEKREDGWYWAEYDGRGGVDYSGRPSICINCHSSGSDSVRAFALPR